MASWLFTPTSINGRTIVASLISQAYFQIANGPLYSRAYAPVSAQITSKAPQDVRGQPQSTTWRLRVSLSAPTEAAKSELRTMFNESEGLVYLRITDGDAVVWRCAVRVLGMEPVNVVQHDVVLFVPDPTWEQDTLQTDTKSNQTASPIAMGTAGVTNNAGTRDCDAKITITADVAKSENSALNDWPYSFESIWVNRARALDNEPVYLMDQSGAAARIATGTAASGAVVRRTTSATTLTADPGAAGTTIAVTIAAAFNVNGGLAVIAWVTGSTFGTMEEIYYTGVSGLNLTGCVRGVGGTTAQAHAIGSAIAASGTMPNGDDVAVWLDGSRLDTRYLVAWNSGSSDIVVNMTAPPVLALTATAAATATVPAVGDVLRFVEGNGSLAAAGFLLWGNEVFHYSAKSGDDGVTIDGRALWGTTAATHSVSALVYANPHRVTVGIGWAKAPPAYAPLATRPCIQLPGSSNQVQKWGDESDDVNTAYYDPLNPERPKMWTPGFDKDGNTVSPLMSLSAYGTIATFKDDVPGDGNPPRNFLEQSFPQGIDAGNANAILNDWTPPDSVLKMELFVRDAGGTWLLKDVTPEDAYFAWASSAARALTSALAVTGYGIKLKARYCVATGVYIAIASGSTKSIANTATSADTAGALAQKFTLTRAVILNAVVIIAASGTGTNQKLDIFLYRDSSGVPVTAAASLEDLTSNAQVIAPTTAFTQLRARFGGGGAAHPFIPGGTYHLVLARPVGDPNTLLVKLDSYGHYLSGGMQLKSATWTPSVRRGETLGFMLETDYLPDGTAPVEADQPVYDVITNARTGKTASFDKTVITLEPLQTVYVHRLTGPVTNGGTGALFHAQCVVANATNGDSLTIGRWMMPTATLAIDTKAGTVNYVEAGIAYPVLASLGAVPQLRLSPGNNTITVTDASLIAPGQMDAVLEHRGARA